MLYSQAAGYLLTTQTTSGTGSAVDVRNAANYALIQHAAASPSAIVKIQASVDSTGWVDVATYTASPTTAFVQQTGYYPYLRAVLNSAFGGGGSTGSASVYIAPGIK